MKSEPVFDEEQTKAFEMSSRTASFGPHRHERRHLVRATSVPLEGEARPSKSTHDVSSVAVTSPTAFPAAQHVPEGTAMGTPSTVHLQQQDFSDVSGVGRNPGASPSSSLSGQISGGIPSRTSTLLQSPGLSRDARRIIGPSTHSASTLSHFACLPQAPLPPLSHAELAQLHASKLFQAKRPHPRLAPGNSPVNVLPRSASLPAGLLLQALPSSAVSPPPPSRPLNVNVPALLPPITTDTLKELDLHEILRCRQLRHDIYFDANLMFRPNLDGDR